MRASSWVHLRFLVRSVLLFISLLCVWLCFSLFVFFFCFISLCPGSCVSNVVSVSGLSILDCPFGFPNVSLTLLFSLFRIIVLYCQWEYWAFCVVCWPLFAFSTFFLSVIVFIVRPCLIYGFWLSVLISNCFLSVWSIIKKYVEDYSENLFSIISTHKLLFVFSLL
jgi:hypothetical protein